MRLFLCLALFAVTSLVCGNKDENIIPLYWTLPQITVLDPTGAPVANAEVAVIKAADPLKAFSYKCTSADGAVTFTNRDYSWSHEVTPPHGLLKILVLARGYPPVLKEYRMPSADPIVVNLADTGKSITVQLLGHDGSMVPSQMVPRFFPLEFSCSFFHSGLHENAESANWPLPLGNGEFQLNINPETTAPLRMLVDHKSFLRGYFYTIETTAALQGEPILIKLPQPGRIITTMQVPEDLEASAATQEFLYIIQAKTQLGGLNAIWDWSEPAIRKAGSDRTLIFPNLAPGNYVLSIFSSKYDSSKLQPVRPGETTTTVFFYSETPPIQASDLIANVTVKTRSGAPASGQPFRLLDSSYNEVAAGTLGDDGTTTIKSLPGKAGENTEFSLHEMQDGRLIGNIKFPGDATSSTFSFNMPPIIGDAVPDVPFIDVHTSQPVKLSDFRGKIVVLDFWATWCGPCQLPLQHYDDMIAENPQWKDKVVILAASIDEEPEAVRQHVNLRKWNNIRPVWCGPQIRARIPVKTFGVTFYPTVFLINSDGILTDKSGDLGFQIQELLSQK